MNSTADVRLGLSRYGTVHCTSFSRPTTHAALCTPHPLVMRWWVLADACNKCYTQHLKHYILGGLRCRVFQVTNTVYSTLNTTFFCYAILCPNVQMHVANLCTQHIKHQLFLLCDAGSLPADACGQHCTQREGRPWQPRPQTHAALRRSPSEAPVRSAAATQSVSPCSCPHGWRAGPRTMPERWMEKSVISFRHACCFF